MVLNISEEEAEKLKRQYGLALKSFIDNDTDIILNTYKGEERTKTIKSYSRKGKNQAEESKVRKKTQT